MSDLNVVGAAQVAWVARSRRAPARARAGRARPGGRRRGGDPRRAHRGGRPTAEVLREWGDRRADARCERRDGAPRVDRVPLAPAVRRAAATPSTPSAWPERRWPRSPPRGGGIWASVLATRAAVDRELLDARWRRLRPHPARRGDHARGQVRLRADAPRGASPARAARRAAGRRRRSELVVSFLGAHVVPAGIDADAYIAEVLAMLDAVVEQRARRSFTTSPASAACSRPRRR